MLNFNSFFTQGLKSTLRLKPGTNWSHKGQWVQVYSNHEVDRWYVGDFSTVNYKITVEFNSQVKETLNLQLIATPSHVNLVEFGRISTTTKILSFSANVNNSYVTLIANPASPEFSGAKIFFLANYAETINDLTPVSGSQVVQPNRFISEYGFETTGFTIANGLLQVDNVDTDSLVTNSLEIAGASTYLSVVNGVITINSKAGTPGSINNMNIGTTTPGTAIFTTLSVISSLAANPTGNVSIAPGGTATINPGTTGSLNNVIIGDTTARAGTFTDVTVNNTMSADTITADTITATSTLTANATTLNSLTVSNDIVINNAPTSITHATRKDYVDATAAALAIALGG